MCAEELLDASGFTYNPEVFTRSGIQYRNFPFNNAEDSQSFFDYVIKVIKFIDENMNRGNKNVLIHCHNGTDRSTLIAFCYLLYINEYNSSDEAYNVINSKRPKSLGLSTYGELCSSFSKCRIFTQI